MMLSRVAVAFTVVVFLGTTVAPDRALGLDPDVKCQADKLKAAGKKCQCVLFAKFKALKKGTAPDFSKCIAKFDQAFLKAEQKAATQGAACPRDDAEGDKARIAGEIDVVCTDIVTTLAIGCLQAPQQACRAYVLGMRQWIKGKLERWCLPPVR